MSVTDKYPLINTVTNNTFDIESANDTLKDIVMKSYYNLMNTQKEDIGLNRFNLTNNELLYDSNNIYITVSKDLIEQCSRRLYKSSKYYNKVLSITDLILNKDIFIKVPLLYVDGLITFEFKIKCDNDKTTIILPFNRALLKNPHKFTVLYIYNTEITSIKLNKYAITSYNYSLPLNIFNIGIKEDPEYKLLSFIQDTKQLQASPANKTTIVDRKLKIEPTTYSQSIIDTAYEFNLICLSFRYFHENDKVYEVKERLSNSQISAELCVIDKYDMPIPAENIVVYKYNSVVNDYILNNDCSVLRHYPFIYEIKDTNMVSGDKYKIRYFYADIIDDYSYTNLIYPYLKLLKGKMNNENIEEVINIAYFGDMSVDYYLSLFDKYFSFDDYRYIYNMHGYEPHRPNHFDYKIDSMFDFIKHDPEHLRNYVLKQNNCGTNFYAFVSNIDLINRERTNTLPDTGVNFLLPEAAYVFKFNREKNGFIKLRFFVDGIHIAPLYYGSHNDFDYIYLPKSVVKIDSFIEIEKFEEYSFSDDVQLNTLMPPLEIVLDDYSDMNFVPTLKDLYVLNKSTSAIISNDNFQIYVDINGTITPIDSNTYTVLDKFYIKLTDANYDNNQFTISVGKTQELIQNKYSAGSICQAVLAGNFKRIKNYVRVFYNGRLLPYEFWKLINISDINKPYLITRFDITEDADISFDITPYYYELIYSKKEINNDGIIDLKDVVDKPFDLEYYDIYLNGRKLSLPNVIYVSPTKIKLINVDAKYNLQIYKKDRDEEYFGFDTEIIKQPIDDLLDDIDLPNIDKKIIIDGEIDDKKPKNVDPSNTTKEPDFLDFKITSGDDFDLLLFIKDQIIPLKHINPDILQLNSFIIRNYDYVFNNMISDGRSSFNNTVRLNPNLTPTASKIQRIPCDIKL